jgi:hypothetical protein
MSFIDFMMLTTPTPAASPKAFILFNGGVYYSAIDDTPGDTLGHFVIGPGGAKGSRLISELEGLTVEGQKSGWMVMAAGIVQAIDGGGMAGEDYVHRALLSAEAGLAYRNTSTVLDVTYTGPDGSFPAQKFGSDKRNYRFHNKAMFCHHVAEMVSIYRESPLNGDPAWAAYTTRVDNVIAMLADYAEWMKLDGPGSDFDEFFIRTRNMNQLIGAIFFLEVYGKVAGDEELRAQGRSRMAGLFYGEDGRPPGVSPDGVIYENQRADGIGFDGGYMSFSLEMLGVYYDSLDAGTWKDTVRDQLEESTLRWLQCITQEGDEKGNVSTVNPNVWTRVKQTYPSKPGLFPKGWNWDGISYRLLYLNYLLGDGVVDPTLADEVTKIGKSFGHLDGNGGGEGEQFFTILDATDKAEVDGLSASVAWAGIRAIERAGGGDCPDYPTGTLPDPCYILPVEVSYDLRHVEHSSYLVAKPVLHVNTLGFPTVPGTFEDEPADV